MLQSVWNNYESKSKFQFMDAGTYKYIKQKQVGKWFDQVS